MTLKELNSRFIYKLDSDQFGISEVWSGLIEKDGKLYGDCEDYAITLKREAQGFQNWDYWYCKLNGGGHCILVSPDRSSAIDNNTQRVVSLDTYLDMYVVTDLRQYRWYELLLKFMSAKLILYTKGY